MAGFFYRGRNAAVPVDERVIEKMMRYLMLNGIFGSPASRACYSGWKAESAINIARKYIADKIGAESQEIFFTSGITDSNNLAIKTTVNKCGRNGCHIIIPNCHNLISAEMVNELENDGYLVTNLLLPNNTIVTPDEMKRAMCKDTLLVSIAGIDIGVESIANIVEIGKVCRQQGVIFHVDATQCISEMSIDIKKMSVDIMSLSSSKLYGPKGVGALYVRHDTKVWAALAHAKLPDDPPVHKIVGMGEAYRIAKQGILPRLGHSCQLCDW